VIEKNVNMRSKGNNALQFFVSSMSSIFVVPFVSEQSVQEEKNIVVLAGDDVN